MPITMLDPVEFSGIPSLRFVMPVVSADPAGYEAGLIYNSNEKAIKFHNGTTWVALGPAGAGGPPTGTAGGDLQGSYPNPTIKDGAIYDVDINAAAAIAQSKVASLTTDLAAKASTVLVNSMFNDHTSAADPHTGYQKESERGVANGYAPLDANSLVPTANIPPLAINEVFTAASDAAMIALVAQRGDMCIRTDNGKTFVLSTDVPSVLGNWKEILSAGAVQSVNGATGVVVITAASISAVPTTRTITAGNGLTQAGGPALSADVTLNVVGDANLSVTADQVAVLSAPKWATARTISLTGDVTGSASVDGSANASIATTVVGGTKHFAGDVGAGTAVVVTHSLNSKDVTVEVYRNTTPWDTVHCTVERTTVNTVTLKFATAVAAAAFRCVVTGR